jgi:hypothetical protein
MNGKIIDIVRTFEQKFRVTFEVDSIDELNGLEGLIYISVKKLGKRRSLNANAYFHLLVGKIAEKNNTSKAYAKNLLMARYGQEEFVDGKRYIISVESSIPICEREDIHCKAIGYGIVNGKEFTHYCVLRPTHLYDSLEMAALIDGTVEEAKELGIATMTPNEIERIKSLWKSGKT